MFKSRLLKIGKWIKGLVDNKIEACKEILLEAQNRLILGLTIFGIGIGLGGGLIASAYIRVM